MSEWFYEEAGRIARIEENFWQRLNNFELVKPTRAYTENVNYIRHFWQLPPFSIDIFSIFYDALTESAIRLTGEPKLDPKIHAHLREQVEKETRARLVAKLAELDPEEGHARFLRSLDAFSHLVADMPIVANAIRATLTTQLVLAWTAFEALSGDLARAADRACNCEHRVLPQKQGFQSLRDGIQAAYDKLFPDDSDIQGIVFDKALRRLNLVRNLATHKAGVVDQAFLDYAKQIEWDHGWKLDEKFPVNGKTIRELASPVIKLGVSLILAVDHRVTLVRKEQGLH